MKEKFFQILNKCYINKVEDNVYYIYDIQYIRQRKLNRILDNEELPSDVDGEIYFEADLKYHRFIVCDKIWEIFEKEFGDYFKTKQAIFEWLKDSFENLIPEPRTLGFTIKSKWTVEMTKDLKTQMGINLVQTIENELIEEISKNISDNIKQKIIKYNYDNNNSLDGSSINM